jgi:4-amino-4-deoxy-L-arabinose transferase-like glycosyltransferase
MPRNPASGPTRAWDSTTVRGGLTLAKDRLAAVPGVAAAPGSSRSLGRLGVAALAFAIVSGLVTHGYHLFQYPLYSTDEGIYVERAWAVIREGRLNTFTYYYDHAPAGWMLLGAWDFLLPGHFEAFGNPVNSGRVLMLLLHAASVFFLFQIARKFSGGLLAPTIACFFFNFSPLGIYYQRMVLLDNIMVFWVLLSIYLLLRRESQLFSGAWSGLAFGLAVVCKENAIFFAPTIFYLLFRRAQGDPNRRFAMTLWLFAASAPVLTYFLLATLKGELLPSDLSFNLNHSPQGHVSLLYEMWYQLHRNQGTLITNGSFLYTMWLPKDPFLLAAGAAAMLISLYLGWRNKERNLSFLVAGTLAAEIAFYLLRGSVILDFYVIPLIPLFALNIGLVADRALKALPAGMARFAVTVVPALAAALLLLPTGGYLLTHDSQTGKLKENDVYYLPLTYLQQEQIAWIRGHIPPTATIISDDDIWVALHDVRPSYPYDQSHWEAASDPVVRNKMFGADWRNIDYIVLSNGMKQAMILNNTGGQEDYILNALDNHSAEVWHDSRGNVSLAIYQVQK